MHRDLALKVVLNNILYENMIKTWLRGSRLDKTLFYARSHITSSNQFLATCCEKGTIKNMNNK